MVVLTTGILGFRNVLAQCNIKTPLLQVEGYKIWMHSHQAKISMLYKIENVVLAHEVLPEIQLGQSIDPTCTSCNPSDISLAILCL